MPRHSNKIELICEQCGEHFFVIPFFIKIGRGRFCSIQCRAKARNSKVEVTCQICGNSFETWPCRRNLGYGKFCSKRCFYKSLQGKPLVEATLKAAEVNKDRPRSPEAIAKTVAGNRGKHLSDEHRQLLSSLAKERVGQKNPFYGKQHSIKTRRQLSKAQKLNWEDPEYRIREIESGRERWRDPEFIKRMMIAFQKKPTAPEKYLDAIITEYFPQFEYNGDCRLGVVLAGLVPDFVNVNGKKQVIEVFGNYWHSSEVLGDRWQGTELGKIMKYNSVGYKCLVIWERELKNLSQGQIVDKVKAFTRGRR